MLFNVKVTAGKSSRRVKAVIRDDSDFLEVRIPSIAPVASKLNEDRKARFLAGEVIDFGWDLKVQKVG